MPRDQEIAELIADIKEQVLYLQELGIDHLSVELAPLAEPPAAAASAATVWKTEPLPREPRPSVGTNAPPKRAGSRLSSLPSLSKRRSSRENGNIIEDDAPVKPVEPVAEAAQRPAGDSLFGEIGPTLPESGETIGSIWAEIGDCTRCPLHQGRTQVVHTTGNYNADLMFIGEAPGADEDVQGEPFVGRAGQLLDKIIEAIGMTRQEVAIGNINRCRPPGNRAPTHEEAHTCRPFLLREIAVIRPKVIVVMGNTALHNLLDTKDGITKVRGKFQDYFGVKVMPTFHPAYLVRDPHKKKFTWEDMKMVRDYLNSQEDRAD